VRRVPPPASAPSGVEPEERGSASGYAFDLFSTILSPALLEWLTNTTNNRVPPDSRRGRPPVPFDTAEIAAILRMMLGYFNLHGVEFMDYLRSFNRLGYFNRSGKTMHVTEKRFYKFRAVWTGAAEDSHRLFDSLSEGLRSVVVIPHLDGTSELALDESMIPWSNIEHLNSTFIPRKPEPIGLKTFLLATELRFAKLPITLHVFPDIYDGSSLSAQVCSLCFGDSNEYSQDLLAGSTRYDGRANQEIAPKSTDVASYHPDGRCVVQQLHQTTQSRQRQHLLVRYNQSSGN
jgi:hypothetical protein